MPRYHRNSNKIVCKININHLLYCAWYSFAFRCWLWKAILDIKNVLRSELEQFHFWTQLVAICQSCHHKIKQIGWLRQQKFISHISGGWKFEIKVLARLGSSWNLFSRAHFCVLPWPHLWAGEERERETSGVFPYKDTDPFRSRTPPPTLRISVNLSYFLRGCISQHSHTGVRRQHVAVKGNRHSEGWDRGSATQSHGDKQTSFHQSFASKKNEGCVAWRHEGMSVSPHPHAGRNEGCVVCLLFLHTLAFA